MDYDLIIRHGTIVEGTRLPRFRGDIGVKNGKVAKMGRIPKTATAGRVLDATDCIVAPGFVDLHTHYDAQIHWDPYCTTSGWHGVTSVAIGNCGFGFAPVKPAERDRSLLMMTRNEQIPYETMKAGMKFTWETFPEWLDAMEKLPKGVNVLSYMPVNPLMIYVMGLEAAKSRPATPAERKEMQRLLHQAMDAGACGFSIQRLGAHSAQADYDGTPMPTDLMADEDIFALAEVLRERDEGFIQITQAAVGDVYYSDLDARARDHLFLERLAEVAQRPVLHNTVAVVDDIPTAHHKELKWVHECNEKKGLRIMAQGITLRNYLNFTLEDWNLYDGSPAWNAACQGSVAERKRKFADPAIRERMKAEHGKLLAVGKSIMPEGLTVLKTPGAPELEKYVGRRIADIAQEQNKHVTDAMLDIALAGDLKVEFHSGLLTSGNPDLVGELANDPYVIPGTSDGGAHVRFTTGGSYTTDFLTWLVRDHGKVNLEEAHFRLSYLAAQSAGFLDRGFLREGAPADIVVYNMQELSRAPDWGNEILRDMPANEWRRVERAKGYRWTLVNGVVTFEGDVCTGATPGKLLRNGRVALAFDQSAAA